jgi:hypothetical protein
LKSTISNGKINSETVKSTNVRSKINLCTKSLIIRKKNSQCDYLYREETLPQRNSKGTANNFEAKLIKKLMQLANT